jgi:hypothetical protein
VKGVGIIINRAENNLTAKVFVTLFNSLRPAGTLLRALELEEGKCNQVKMELFWKGFRDYAIGDSQCRQKFYREYMRIIPGIRAAVKSTRLKMRGTFYTGDDRDKLFNELRNTEVDVALFTDNKIYLGEAKRKEKLGSNGRNILAHQFLRQRVMVEVWKALNNDKRDLVSFIICDRTKMKSIRRMEQVKALQFFDGRRPSVISWQDVLENIQQSSDVISLREEVEKILSVD